MENQHAQLFRSAAASYQNARDTLTGLIAAIAEANTGQGLQADEVATEYLVSLAMGQALIGEGPIPEPESAFLGSAVGLAQLVADLMMDAASRQLTITELRVVGLDAVELRFAPSDQQFWDRWRQYAAGQGVELHLAMAPAAPEA